MYLVRNPCIAFWSCLQLKLLGLGLGLALALPLWADLDIIYSVPTS